MKPYLLAAWNVLRLGLKKVHTRNLKTGGLVLLGWNSRLVFGRGSDITLGSRLISDGRMVMIVDDGASLRIGSGVYFNEQAMISCKGSIHIGDGCKFGPNVKLFDNNHRFDPVNGVTNAHSVGSISIGDHSWIGANAVILKGAQIGRNCVIGAGCVVSGTIPDGSVVTQGRELTIRSMQE